MYTYYFSNSLCPTNAAIVSSAKFLICKPTKFIRDFVGIQFIAKTFRMLYGSSLLLQSFQIR